jgi:hypothetical protein
VIKYLVLLPRTAAADAEGNVDASFNAVPELAAGGQVGRSYAALNRERNERASARPRTIQTYEDNREQNLSRLVAARAGNIDAKARVRCRR